jgi:WD40 repeat protein
VYNGTDGRPIAKLPLNGDQGLAVSPDGKSLAVGKRLRKAKDIDLLVEIYDIASGQLVATGTHDQVPPGRFQNLNGVFDNDNGLRFTSDGEYLITSGNNKIKFWEQ